MWNRFTERARRAVFFAQEAARHYRQPSVNTEHLLRGLLQEDDTVAAQMLTALHVSSDELRAALRGQMQTGRKPAPQELNLTPRCHRAIDLAYEEARALSNDYCGTEHLLLGLLRERQGMAAQVLEAHGVTLEAARQAAIAIQNKESPAQPTGKQKRIRPQDDISQAMYILRESRNRRFFAAVPWPNAGAALLLGAGAIILFLHALVYENLFALVFSIVSGWVSWWMFHTQMTKMEAIAAHNLIECSEKRAIPELVRLLSWRDAEIRAGAKEALTRLLPHVLPEDAGLFDSEAHDALNKMLSWFNVGNAPELVLAILAAFMQVGTARNYHAVQRLDRMKAVSKNDKRIKQAAESCLQSFIERRENERMGRTLLRPSAPQSACPDELLRPAAQSPASDPAELLRPSVDADASP